MEEVDYKRVREVMWTDKKYHLRELPDFYGFPLLIKVTKGASDVEESQKFAKGEVFRVEGEEKQRRMIATDAKGRHWSFPVHLGTKFDVPDKKERRSSVYMSDIVELKKLPKKFSFAKKDVMQIKITGEDPSKVGPLIEGNFKTKEVTRVRIFKANRIADDEIDPKVVFLPAYLDLEVVIATKLACEPDALWEDYMDAMTRDISKMVNLNMYRGKSDIQIYEFPEKMKKSKRNSWSVYEEVTPVKVVTIRSIIINRTPSTKSRTSIDDGKPMNSNCSSPTMSTFIPCEGAEAKEEPTRPVVDILRDLQDKDESEMSEEEIRLAKHRRKLLAFLQEEEEEEKRKSQLLEEEEGGGGGGNTADGIDGSDNDDGKDDDDDDDGDDDDDDDNDDDDDDDDDEANAAKARGKGDGNDIEETDGLPSSFDSSPEDEQLAQVSEQPVTPTRPRSPGDGSPVVEDYSDSVFVEDSPENVKNSNEVVKPKIPPRKPTRHTPGLSYPQARTSQELDSETDKEPSRVQTTPPNPGNERPTPPPKPRAKPPVPPQKPALRPVAVPRVATKVSRAHVASATSQARFASIQDYPADLRGLSIDDMCQALTFLRLDKYEAQIRDNKIDGEMATELTEEIIKSELGFSGFEARKFFKFIHQNWRPV